jgi:hypothetical protein
LVCFNKSGMCGMYCAMDRGSGQTNDKTMCFQMVNHGTGIVLSNKVVYLKYLK